MPNESRLRNSFPWSAFTLFGALALCSCATTSGLKKDPQELKDPAIMIPLSYPKTREVPLVETLHGLSISDPYRYLEKSDDPEVVAWTAAQDQFARERLLPLPGRDRLVERLKELYYVESLSLPQGRGGRLFYYRIRPDREKAILYYRDGERGTEKVLLDPNQMSEDGSISIGVIAPSQDGKYLAYSLRRNNADEATLYVLHIESETVSDVDVLVGARYASPKWTPQGDGFFYTYLPEADKGVSVADRPGLSEVRFHRLGTDQKDDPLIHEKTGDPKTFLSCDLSEDGRFAFLYVQHGWNATDVYVRKVPPPQKPKGLAPKKPKRGKNRFAQTLLRTFPPVAEGWVPLALGQKTDAQYQVEAYEDHFYIHTNEGAPRWRIFSAPASNFAREGWKEIVPEDPEAALESMQIIGGHLALSYLRKAHHHLELRPLSGDPQKRRVLPLPGMGTAFMSGEPSGKEFFYSFASFTTPLSIRRASVTDEKSKGDTLFFETHLQIDPSPYVVEQVYYLSKDGTKISMFLVHRKDLKRDGKTPFLLSGYGGFNISMLPSFSPRLYPWLEAGGGFAMPNLRGGGEYGESWHRAGMGSRKQNTFDDFLSAADYLVRNGYTSKDRLAIRGGSNGGLLVGAALTQRPDLVRAVVCEVPLLDMVRYTLFGSGKTWISEYGSPEAPAELKVLASYSPYHQVKKGTAYPAVLFLSADSDDRVDPMHARKMAAALQNATTSNRPILLRVEKQAGHGGADLLKQAVEQGADTYAFLMDQVGLVP